MTKTTLLEGSIRILKDNQRIVLRPGQQATSTQAAGLVKVKEVDTEEAVAWKNGYFLFDNERLESVMRKISRWYNVYVDYPPGQTIRANYWGSMSREANLSVVLRKLETTNNVRFKLEGNHVIVLRK
jgi:ferric-dicitrate binding protein FerR (iron transport regulator)